MHQSGIVAENQQAERGIADRSAHVEAMTRARTIAPHEAPIGNRTERGDGHHQWAGCCDSIAAKQRTRKDTRFIPQRCRKCGDVLVPDCVRESER